jgi:hypothetical protein
MTTPSLKDPEQFPDEATLKIVLGSSYEAFEALMEIITKPEYSLVAQWNYYNDGKAWLCKVQYKKKTVFWLSAWDRFFKTTFYFTLKNCSGIIELDIDEKIKEDFGSNKSIGKLMPLTMEIQNKEQISDLIKIIGYKKSLK